MAKIITSVNNEYIKKVAKLKDKKYRDEAKLFIVEGYHLVNEAKKYLTDVLITDASDEIDGVNNIIVTDQIIEKLSSVKSPQKIIGICKYFDISEIIGKRFLILDGVQDPGNLGTLIRCALGFDIDTVICSKDTVSIYNEKVIRSTQGAIFHINYYVGDLPMVIEELKRKGVTILSTSLKNSISLNQYDTSNIDSYAIVLGNEGNGVSKEVQEMADVNLCIEMNSKLESLNVSVAGGILMYMLKK